MPARMHAHPPYGPLGIGDLRVTPIRTINRVDTAIAQRHHLVVPDVSRPLRGLPLSVTDLLEASVAAMHRIHAIGVQAQRQVVADVAEPSGVRPERVNGQIGEQTAGGPNERTDERTHSRIQHPNSWVRFTRGCTTGHVDSPIFE